MTSVNTDGVVEFRFYRPGVKQVQVVGSFNAWNAQTLPMRSIGNGWWQAEARIEAGDHMFRYVADGNWFTDFAANGIEKNKYGWNSILIVPERRMRMMPVDEQDIMAEAVAA